MRIGIDGRELCGRPTGVGRYLTHLLAAWGAHPAAEAHEFVLFIPDCLDCTAVDTLPRRPSLDVSVVPVPGGSGTAWEQWYLPRALPARHLDVLFCPAYTAPLVAGVPRVVTIHDVSFLAHPEWFPARSRLRRRALTTLAARRARLVLTVSEFSRSEITSRLGIDPAKVRAIPHGLTSPRGAAGTARTGLPARPLVLYVGSIFNRRHLPELIAAVGRVAAHHPEVGLEIVGEDRTHPPQDLAGLAAASGGRVRLRSYIPDAELASLYAQAGAFAFLSDYEGFGLTPLEAMASGCPAVVGDTPVAREVYGDAAAYVPTTDVPAIAAHLEALLFDASARRSLLAAAPGVLTRYSWDRVGRETLEALEEAGRD